MHFSGGASPGKFYQPSTAADFRASIYPSQSEKLELFSALLLTSMVTLNVTSEVKVMQHRSRSEDKFAVTFLLMKYSNHLELSTHPYPQPWFHWEDLL